MPVSSNLSVNTDKSKSGNKKEEIDKIENTAPLYAIWNVKFGFNRGMTVEQTLYDWDYKKIDGTKQNLKNLQESPKRCP